MNEGERIVGIDLGTSNTVVAIIDDLDRVQVLPDAAGNTVHPSVVSFHPGGGVVIGVKGKQRKVLDPTNTIYSAKRMIGQPFRSFAVTETARRVPFQIKEGPNEQAMVITRAGEFAIPEISAIVLDHVGKLASAAIKSEVSRAVVTVPASFTDVQRASTATAGALAGLTVVRVLNEPTAAALAYGSTKKLNEIIAVYDFGGGTFDITILKLEDQVYTVLGTSGDAFLGGEDIDERIVENMVEGFLREHRVDLRTDPVSMMRLRAVAEHTKIELSRRSRAVVKVEEVAYAPNGTPLDLTMQLTRDELIAAIGDLVNRTFVSCKEAMALAGVAQNQIADVILVGGTTRIPIVRDQVARFFGMVPRSDVNPDDAIATGAALQASSIEQMLSRAPQRPQGAVPVDKPAAESGTRRHKEEPAQTVARAEAFFGDLFGDKAAKPDAATVQNQPVPVVPTPRSRPARQSKDLDWQPPEGSAFSDDPDAVDVFSSEPATADARLADLSEDVEVEPETPRRTAPPKLASVDDISIEVAEPPRRTRPADSIIPVEVSMPAIELDDLDDIHEIDDLEDVPPQGERREDSEIAIEVSMPSIRLDDIDVVPERAAPRDERSARRSPPELDWAPPAGVELAREIVVPAPVVRPTPVSADDIELAPSTPPSRTSLDLEAEPPMHADDFADDARAQPRTRELIRDSSSTQELSGEILVPPKVPVRHAAKELDWDPVPTPYSSPAPRAPIARPEPPRPQPEPPPAPYTPPARAPATNMRGPAATVIDVTPRGLGIATVAGFCEELIGRNSQLPASIRKSFVTSRDAQETVRIVICQGESRRLASNLVIGDLVLPNLPRRARGETRIEVEFALDASGILHVSARDSATGSEQHARLDLKGGMATEDLTKASKRLQDLAAVPVDR